MKKILYSCLFVFLIASTCLVLSNRPGFTTGGAFTSTKHGGATADGVTPFNNGNGAGVDRSVNPDYGSHYNDQSSEAGKYKGAECNQCHELHGSFGGSEPEPANGTPSIYLAMRYGNEVNNYAELCWYCHENMSLNSNPTGYGYWDFYQGLSIFQESSHYLSNNFYWPGTTGDPVDIWPRQNRSSLHSANVGSCLNCHTPHGIMETDGNEFDTSAVPAFRHLSENNESVSKDYLIPRQLIAWEEALCENCHDSSGPAPSDIQTEINKRGSYTGTGTTDWSGGSGHLVDYTTIAGRHSADEGTVITKKTTAGDLKHVECYDCHNPHTATGTGSGGSSYPGSTSFNRLAGMSFVRCDSTDCSGTATDPAELGRDPFVHEVCLRCHGDGWSDFFDASNIYPTATNTRPSGLSNKRLEFNPDSTDATYGPVQSYNSAFHPVAAPGNNTSLAMCLSLQSAFNLDCSSSAGAGAELSALTINCTDCHNNDALGGVSGPVTESSLRTTDHGSNYSGNSVVGPHASQVPTPSLNFASGASDNGDRSILRDYYFTGSIPTTNRPFNAPTSTAEFQDRFKLCFNCHDWNTFYGNNDNTGFFQDGGGMDGGGSGGMGGGGMDGGGGGMGMGPNNLHAFHLNGQGGGMMWNSTYEACITCHYNIHSNVQATNTTYTGGGSLPPDGDTHLINFAPNVVTNRSYSKPAWFYSGGVMNCNLNCHGVAMVYTYSCTHSVTGGTTDTCND